MRSSTVSFLGEGKSIQKVKKQGRDERNEKHVGMSGMLVREEGKSI